MCVWRFGWSWPWKRAEKKALIEDLEAANAKLAKTEEGRRLRVAQRRLGEEVVQGMIESDPLESYLRPSMLVDVRKVRFYFLFAFLRYGGDWFMGG